MFTQLLISMFAAPCPSASFFGIPPWYKYLIGGNNPRMAINDVTGACELVGGIQWDGGGDIVLIALGLLDIALRIAGMVAIGFIIYGGILYVVSSGQPDKTKDAQETIINALIGLVIATIATVFVSFLGNKIG